MTELIELLRNFRWLIIAAACLSQIGLAVVAVQIYREERNRGVIMWYDWHGRVIRRGLRL